MKKLIGLFLFALVLSIGMASLSYAAGDMAAPSTQTVNGDLLKIDGEFYVVKEMSAKMPIGRLIEPEEIAAFAAYLCSPFADAITGQSIAVDGGAAMSVHY